MKTIDKIKWLKTPLSQIFDISYGNKLDLCNLVETEPANGVAFVTRTALNNGVGAFVEEIENVKPFKKGCITVALGGSLGSTFIQPQDFYTAQNVAVLIPRINLMDSQKLFICTLIRYESNTRFIAFGRELNKHIAKDFTINLPDNGYGEIDWEWVSEYMDTFYSDNPVTKTSNKSLPEIDIDGWKPYRIGDLFKSSDYTQPMSRGKIHSADSLPEGEDYFYVGAKKRCNGIMQLCGYSEELISQGNCIIFICNGQGSVGYSLYMDRDFFASGDLMLGYHPMLNKYNALFIVSILDRERPKYSFGRKYGAHVNDTIIYLPTKNEQPDWQYMESYIKRLPFGDCI